MVWIGLKGSELGVFVIKNTNRYFNAKGMYVYVKLGNHKRNSAALVRLISQTIEALQKRKGTVKVKHTKRKGGKDGSELYRNLAAILQHCSSTV